MRGDERLERYRLNAEKCLELAQSFNDQERKRIMVGMANAWLTLAEQHLRNSESGLLYETLTTANERSPPVSAPPTPPADEPRRPPPVNDPAPAKEPPQLHPANEPDDPMQ